MVDNMEWFNVFGLIFIAVIMIPNVVFAIKCKDGFDNKWNNKYVEVTEQVGRLGCFGFMIINIPGKIIELNKLAGEPIDVLVNGKYVAKGEVVVIEESFGVRITEIVNASRTGGK